MSDMEIPHWLRYHPPLPPRDVEVLCAEQHCDPGCVHMTESYRRGFEAGARAERERQERQPGGLAVAMTFLAFAFMALAAVVRAMVER